MPDIDILPDPTEGPPADTIACHPGLYEPDQIARVLACGFKSTLAHEIDKLDARSFIERPKARYTLRDAVIAGGWIYPQKGRLFMSSTSPFRALGQKIRRYDKATLLNSAQGLKYFGHWLRDDCAVYEDIRDTPNLISMQRAYWPDAQIYEAAFDHVWHDVAFAHVGELTLYRELGFNRDKARRLRLLRQRLRASHPAPNAGKIVYIRRGQLGAARDIAHQDAFETALAAAGIHIVEPGLAGQNLAREVLDAAMIITVEGSQAGHGVYCLADGGAMLILQPPERFYNPHHEWTRLLGMGYGITIGEKEGAAFRIHPDEVFAMIDRLQAAPRISDA
ncbi:glycosyltransferase 61 family protein [Yoonia sp.]|uniref:glycosyltransferase 61 family protein n=1 Tax=Yoonia sp. TaxID=2212373 RepID=UPI0019F909B3|nr:glycosyltransferase 61 family protein [Yoonia sp.]MBE0414737.1 DUF563 domain-containing protein [Yoonia sp.]